MNVSSPLSYRGNGFAVALPDGWNDATLHVLQGPTAAGHPHAITIQSLADVEADTLEDFADPLVETAKQSLREATVLVYDIIFLDAPPPQEAPQQKDRQRTAPPRRRRQQPVQLPPDRAENSSRGPRARRAILRWQPEDARQPHYQEQLFVLTDDGTGYVLSASFTQQSRRQFGARVERIMRSFCPTVQDA